MATNPNGDGVLLFGGRTFFDMSLDTILELKSDGQGWVGEWTTLTAKLQHARRHHIVIPISMDENSNCDLSGIIPDVGPTTTTTTITPTTTTDSITGKDITQEIETCRRKGILNPIKTALMYADTWVSCWRCQPEKTSSYHNLTIE